MKHSILALSVASLCVLVSACGEQASPPAAPSSAPGEHTAASTSDGSTLKATAPSPYSPANGGVTSSLTPNLVVANATLTQVGGKTSASILSYRFVVETTAGAAVVSTLAPTAEGAYATLGITGSRVPEKLLQPNTAYRWRARAELGSAVGPWSSYWTLKTPAPAPVPAPVPTPTPGPSPAPVPSAPRRIGIDEAVAIIRFVYDDNRYNIGSASTRDQRNAYLERAVAVLHYGHSRYNPQGPDAKWCIKSAGAGRPQSDDVIARCDTREAWDLVGGIGADGYSWAPHYLGVLSAEQHVYAPSASALNALPR